MKTKNIFKKIACLVALCTMLIGSTLTVAAEGGVVTYYKADGTVTFVNENAVPAVGSNGLPVWRREYQKAASEVTGITPGGIYIYGNWGNLYTPEQIALLYFIIDASGITNEMSKYDKAVLLNNAECAVLYPTEWQIGPFGDGLCSLQIGAGGNCMPYSDLYQTLCQAVGIDCEIIAGYAHEGGKGHQWNVLSINGKEYYNDVLWNDQSGNAYLMWETPMHYEEARSTTPEGAARINPTPLELRMLSVRNYGPEDAARFNATTMPNG